MPNTFFQFKQFIIHQDKCAMKVCTDSCVFGAWIEVEKNVKSILDIGTGTGLLSLMLAQKSAATIDAIELEENAFSQAKENIQNSPWKERIHSHHGDIRHYKFEKKFDLIICNPPFYDKQVKSYLHEERLAKHSQHLTLAELIKVMKKLLSVDGKFAVLLPYYRKAEMEKLCAKHSFYPETTLSIRQTSDHDFFRYAAIFSKTNIPPIEREIAIKHKNEYTPEAVGLLRSYYLHM